MYSRQDYEQELREIDSLRHDTRTLLVIGHIDGLKAKMLLDELDRREKRCDGKLVGTRLALQDRDLMRKRWNAVFVVCSRKRWVMQQTGRWVVCSLKDCIDLAKAGNLIILLVPYQDKQWYEERYRGLGFRIQVKAARREREDEGTEQDGNNTPELIHDPVARRTLQLVPVEVARELCRREHEAVLAAKLANTRCPETTEIIWAPDGNLDVAGLVVWQEAQ
jgi:hypothetical protein